LAGTLEKRVNVPGIVPDGFALAQVGQSNEQVIARI